MDKIVAIREETTKNSMLSKNELCTCDCGKPKFPKTSKKHIKSISSAQTSGTKILEKRGSIVDILNQYGRPLNIMEIGVMAGDFAEYLYDNLPVNKMVLIDPFNNEDYMSHDGQKRFNSEENLKYVRSRFSNKNNVEIIPGFSNDIINRHFLGMEQSDRFDFIYIDSNHEYYNTFNEILYSSQILKEDGIIGIDDYTLSLNDPLIVCETMQAVTEFLSTNQDWKVAYYSFNDAGLPNIFLSKCFSNEHPRLDSNQRLTA